MSTAPPKARSCGFRIAAFGTALHAVLISVMLGYSLWRIPEASRDFDEFGVSLPSLTRTVLRVSGTTTENWQTLMPILPLVPLAGFVIAMFIGRCCPVSQKLWVSAATLVLVGCLVCQVVGIELPLMTLRDGLSM